LYFYFLIFKDMNSSSSSSSGGIGGIIISTFIAPSTRSTNTMMTKPRSGKKGGNGDDEDDIVAYSAVKNVLGEQMRGSKSSPLIKLVAGMAGGVAEATLLQPLDVAKTRLQLDKAKKYKGMFNCLKTIVAEEGFAALYKGLTPFITHLAFKYALRFGLYEQFRVLLNGGNTGKSSNSVNFFSGMLVGCVEATLIVTPFEVIKTRLQQQTGTKNLKYSGPIDVVRKVTAEEGVRRLWSGNMPTVIRQGSNQAFNFMSMQILNDYLWDKRDGDGKTLEVWKTLLNGLLAGAVGPCFNAPVDVVKTRMMAQKYTPGVPVKYTGWIQATKLIVHEEGMAALWKGLIPRLTRLAPGQAITWCVHFFFFL
jgi:solute carrier family 25 citrate transporter 1